MIKQTLNVILKEFKYVKFRKKKSNVMKNVLIANTLFSQIFLSDNNWLNNSRGVKRYQIF